MKLYEKRLKSIKQIGETLDVNYKTVFRASAIFPVLHTKHFSSENLFLGYWLLKRKIKEIGLVITLRSEKGVFLNGQPGSIKIHHEFTSFFPRFIAGNSQKSPHLMSITYKEDQAGLLPMLITPMLMGSILM